MYSSMTLSSKRSDLFAKVEPTGVVLQAVLAVVLSLMGLLSVRPASAAAAYVQGTYSDPSSSNVSSLSVTFPSAQQAGDTNVIAIGAGKRCRA